MRTSVLLAALLLLSSVGALAQSGGQQAPATPHKKVKPKKVEPKVIILKVVDKTGATGEESLDRSLFARAGVLTVFKFKKIEDISPAEIQGTIDQLEIDFSKPENWTSDNFDKLAEPWEATYIAGVTVDALQDAKTVGAKDPSVMAEADFTVWLYDVKLHKFLVEHESSHYIYKVKKGDDAMDPKSVAYQVISSGAKEAFLTALKSKPK